MPKLHIVLGSLGAYLVLGMIVALADTALGGSSWATVGLSSSALTYVLTAVLLWPIVVGNWVFGSHKAG